MPARQILAQPPRDVLQEVVALVAVVLLEHLERGAQPLEMLHRYVLSLVQRKREEERPIVLGLQQLVNIGESSDERFRFLLRKGPLGVVLEQLCEDHVEVSRVNSLDLAAHRVEQHVEAPDVHGRSPVLDVSCAESGEKRLTNGRCELSPGI
jgi:hypothetical protein